MVRAGRLDSVLNETSGVRRSRGARRRVGVPPLRSRARDRSGGHPGAITDGYVQLFDKMTE
jgi:hypothetical protein